MKKTSRVFTILATGAATLLMTSVSANNGIQYDEFDFVGTAAYVGCLGDTVTPQGHIRVAFHEFETPSGTIHVIENWSVTLLWIGASGDTWVGRVKSPFQLNIGPAVTNQWVYQGIQKPLTGDGPRFFFKDSFKLTITANGDFVVLREIEDINDKIRCFGKA